MEDNKANTFKKTPAPKKAKNLKKTYLNFAQFLVVVVIVQFAQFQADVLFPFVNHLLSMFRKVFDFRQLALSMERRHLLLWTAVAVRQNRVAFAGKETAELLHQRTGMGRVVVCIFVAGVVIAALIGIVLLFGRRR